MLDLLIINAKLLWAVSGKKSLSCIGIAKGKIQCVLPCSVKARKNLPTARKILDAGGNYLFPGFIDFHTHLFRHGSQFGLDADKLPSSGVTAAIDMGSAGWVNFPAMYRCDLLGKKIRTGAFLNISPVGQPGRGITEPLDDAAVSADGIRQVLQEYPGAISGLKVRLSRNIVKDLGAKPLARAIELGDRFGLPVCVHTTDPPVPADEIAAALRPGDIYSHTYQGAGHTAADSEEVIRRMLDAQKRGVLIEVGNGTKNFSFRVAEICTKKGLYPDIISSDATPMTYQKGPSMWDLARVVSKFLLLGMPLADAIRAVTVTPARLLGLDHEIGSIAPGYEADLAIFRMDHSEILFCDSEGCERTGKAGLIPLMTLRSGQVIWHSEDSRLKVTEQTPDSAE